MKNSEKPQICFYGLYCYPLFNPQYGGVIGGWETRMALIAKELVRRGDFDVTVIVADYGQPHIEYLEGVRLISWPGRKGNSSASVGSSVHSGGEIKSDLKERSRVFFDMIWEKYGRKVISLKTKTTISFLLRGLYGVLRELLRALQNILVVLSEVIRLWRGIYSFLDRKGHIIVWREDINILDEANCDIYVVFGNHRMSAVVASYCIKKKKKFVFSAGSEYDYYPEYKTDSDGRDIYGESHLEKVFAIENAALHIVQTPRQAQMLKEGYGRDSVVVRNPIDLSTVIPRPANPKNILWVGKSDERVKRPSLIFKLARSLPEYPFVIVMNKAIPETHNLFSSVAEYLPNVTLIENVPYGEIDNLFASARLFVSTSVFEGFPNTFLQAAKYGVPIVATDIDPGEMLSLHRSGITCGGDFTIFTKSVRRLMEDDVLHSELGANAFNYVCAYHERETVITQYANALKQSV